MYGPLFLFNNYVISTRYEEKSYTIDISACMVLMLCV